MEPMVSFSMRSSQNELLWFFNVGSFEGAFDDKDDTGQLSLIGLSAKDLSKGAHSHSGGGHQIKGNDTIGMLNTRLAQDCGKRQAEARQSLKKASYPITDLQ
jgi:hypothetical protein